MPTLEQLYSDYLKSSLNHIVGMDLVRGLENAGLHQEGKYLRIYLEHGSTKLDDLSIHPLLGKVSCHMGLMPPHNFNSFDIWFDPVEVSLSIAVPTPRRHRNDTNQIWVKLHPIYVWQYKGFLEVFEWKFCR